MSGQETPSQTIGPFFAILLPLGTNELVRAANSGALSIEGQVFDVHRDPVKDELVEISQANRAGRYDHPADDRGLPIDPAFTGFGRCSTDQHGRFRFVTVKPGPVPIAEDELQAPHINVSVFARGLLDRVVTRIYFPDEAEANAWDPVLTSIEDPLVRATLVAADEGARRLRFDVHLQGERETAFFAV